MTDISKEAALQQLRAAFIPQGPFNITPYFAKSASGAIIYDVEGREFIDFAGGIGVMNVGHCHPKVVAAIKAQAEQFTHTCFHIMMYEPYIELARQICELMPGDSEKMAMFANSGAEAVENAIKIARHYTGRDAIIALENGFHGRTYMGMSLTSKVKPYKHGFGPMMSEIYRFPSAYCYRCPLGLNYPECDVACADALNDFFISYVGAENTAALIAEPVLGEGGFITPPPEYFPKLIKICRDNGILFIADEVQAGFGRTGKMMAMEHWSEEADITTLGKSMAGGMPLSAVVGKKEIMNSPQAGGLGGTYGGNPICCAAALGVLSAFKEENLVARSAELGETLRQTFESWKSRYELIGDVRGLGPMLALELVTDREAKTPAASQAKELVKFCFEHGLIILSCGNYGNVIRTLMPIVITKEQLDRGLAILEEGIATISK